MENNENKSENRVTKIFQSIREAFAFVRTNKEKKCKVRSQIGCNDYYVSYILNQTQED